MERDRVLRGIREEHHTLPPDFDMARKALQGEIILSLISWRPSERPTTTELLKGGKLPAQIEDDTIRQALKGISDRNSPYHQKMISALFSRPTEPNVINYTWDLNGKSSEGLDDLLIKSLVRSRLSSIFRRHGAVETQRPLLLPRSGHYSANVYQLLDSSGTMLQLPYDLTLPNARVLAKQTPSSKKTYTFGNVYREAFTGGPPKEFGEIDFDLTSDDSLDMALKEAEVIKVMDEIVDGFSALQSAQFCFHLNHSHLLELILDFCRISMPQRPIVKEIISKLHIGVWSWPKIRAELRSPTLNIHITSLNDLVRFDFRGKVNEQARF
jgi:translation initiation factor 2-alpha kinase 4